VAEEKQSKRSSSSAKQQEQANAGDVEPRNEVDESANTSVFLADIGETLTSHGDGTPTVSPQLQELAKEEAERNADPDRDNRELARRLGADV
jgi:hypothetical protein